MDGTYLDYNSTYPTCKQHVDAVVAKVLGSDANPSNLHSFGRKAKLLLEKARQNTASYLCENDPKTIVFNSGATEGINYIVSGFAEKYGENPKKTPVVIISEGEHAAVYDLVEYLELRGKIKALRVGLQKSGRVCLDSLAEKMKEVTSKDTPVLCMFIHVNNETGVINPIDEISKSIADFSGHHSAPVYFGLDCVQALGKVPRAAFEEIAYDFAVFSGHKLGALKGAGFVHIKNKDKKLPPLIRGGSQERALRAGTENLIGIVSLGEKVLELTRGKTLLPDREVFDGFVNALSAKEGCFIHGDLSSTCLSTINFHLSGRSADEVNLLFDMSAVALSNGSACSSGVRKPSRVLVAMGYSEEIASNSFRVSMSDKTSSRDLEAFKAVFDSL